MGSWFYSYCSLKLSDMCEQRFLVWVCANDGRATSSNRAKRKEQVLIQLLIDSSPGRRLRGFSPYILTIRILCLCVSVSMGPVRG